MSLLSTHDSEIALLQRGTRRFLLSGAAVLMLVLGAMLLHQGLFRQTAALGFVTDSAQDITKGQAVRIAGFRVGAVHRVDLQPDGRVAVELEIDADAMRFVTADATIELRKEGLVGAAVLEILPGPDRSRLAASGARLAFSRVDNLTATLNGLRDRIVPILADVKTITGTLADAQRGLPATLAQVRETNATLQNLLRSSEQQLARLAPAASRTVGQVEGNLALLQQTLGQVNQRLPVLLDAAQMTLTHVQRIAEQAEMGIPPLLQDGRAVASDVRDILTGAKTAWPVRDWVAPPADGSVLDADSDPQAEAVRGAR